MLPAGPRRLVHPRSPLLWSADAQSATPVLMIALRLMRAGAVLSILSSFVLPTNRSSTSHTSPDTTHRHRLAVVTPHIMQLVRQGRSERGKMVLRPGSKAGPSRGSAVDNRVPARAALLVRPLLFRATRRPQTTLRGHGVYFWFSKHHSLD